MEYPHDSDQFEPFVKAYLALLRQYPVAKAPQEKLQNLIADGMPKDAAAILHTLAHHEVPSLVLGWRSLEPPFGLSTAEGTFDAMELEEGADDWFDPSRSLVLGGSVGGEVYFGFHWNGDAARLFELNSQAWEYDEPPITSFDTAEAFWQHVYDYEDEESFKLSNGEPAEFLVKLFSAAGRPLES